MTTLETLRRFIEHAPSDPGDIADGLLGFRWDDGTFCCSICSGRIGARGCRLPEGSRPVWADQGDCPQCDLCEQGDDTVNEYWTKLDNLKDPAAHDAEVLRLLTSGTREELTEYLQWSDRNGCYTDADREAEGLDPMTYQDALACVRATVEQDAEPLVIPGFVQMMARSVYGGSDMGGWHCASLLCSAPNGATTRITRHRSYWDLEWGCEGDMPPTRFTDRFIIETTGRKGEMLALTETSRSILDMVLAAHAKLRTSYRDPGDRDWDDLYENGTREELISWLCQYADGIYSDPDSDAEGIPRMTLGTAREAAWDVMQGHGTGGPDLKVEGFQSVTTGGGCTALGRYYGDHIETLITVHDDPTAPTTRTRLLDVGTTKWETGDIIQFDRAVRRRDLAEVLARHHQLATEAEKGVQS